VGSLRFTAAVILEVGGARIRVSQQEKWWTGGELNFRHRDFQSDQDDEEPVSPHLPQSLERVKKVYDDLGFASERQLDVW
jgi:hypothetical protein